MNLFDFNLLAGSLALFLLVGGYAWREHGAAIACMFAGVIGLLLLILYNLRASAG
ncbi:hypothetical protein [Diaphorobacter aerolatus]|uniref:Uncharacterized protein n=1 Tax=Diaphorobacter aerolatus TaxID=1288495 RepID=A0A7H0GHE8_9BURK|nr:hypothetical protein [Diaphorobacter aerolatus]QNP47714.1 hypothetical protein H9K75_16180 [Diaphorobacter aerolatus]